MPIINRPASKAQAPSNPSLSPTPETSAVPDIPLASSPTPARSGVSLAAWAILALLIGIILPVGGYLGYTKISEPTTIDSESTAADISHSIQRYEKISSMASLAKELYESNFIALQEAEKVANTTTYTALEIVVNKNRQELLQHKQKMTEVLLSLVEISSSDPDIIARQFHEAIVLAEQNDSNESVRLLQLAEKVVRGSPREGDRIGYLREAINDRL